MAWLPYAAAHLILILTLTLAPTAHAATPASFRDRCLTFSPLLGRHLAAAGATLNKLEHIAAGTRLALLPDTDPSCNRAAQAVPVDLCRVALSVPTSARSGFVMELWMPETWGGRTLATGNGGLDGCIKYEDIAYGATNGFSTFGTNNGHNGTSGQAFYQNEDVVLDFSWRALHTSVEIGRELTSRFYAARKVGKSYYIGCSLGGRQGLGSAERFPGDFDGVVAGAPAADFNALYAWRARFFTLTGAAGGSPGFVAPEVWKTTVHAEVLRQCDGGLDGVADGIIEDPALCRFDAARLQCGHDDGDDSGNGTGTDCLTAAQTETVRTIFADYVWPADGALLYPRMNPGSELLAADGVYAGKPYGPSVDWFRYAVRGDPDWDPAAYGVEDAALAIERDPGGITTWPSRDSLAAFRARGGKVLAYHGQQDQQISSLNSARLWERLAGDGGGGDGGGRRGAELDAYFRLFRIPGMNHCSGGPGAWTVGQGGSAASYGIPFDGAHNVLAALVGWVEGGVAPDEITGTKFVDDSVEAGVMYRHRHCRYPYRSTYLGRGDPLDMESWRCARIER
ncbi:tannase and feruloyl esterase [Xylaria palmicola]|nr:tannase and feruloyl esterase [Xylaria palmicola]